MDELFLTSGEEAVFAALPAELKKGWGIEKETYVFKDDAARKSMRFHLLRISDPTLVDFKKRLLTAKSEEQYLAVLKTIDFAKVGNHDFSKLLFALGPDALGFMLLDILTNAESKQDVELVAALSGLRHLMLESLIENDF